MLELICHAYLEGRIKPIDEDFIKCLNVPRHTDNWLKTKLSPLDYQSFKVKNDERQKLFKPIGKDTYQNNKIAFDQFDQTEVYKTPVLNLLGETMQAAALAYLEYKHKHFETALSLMQCSIDKTNLLIGEHQFYFLYMRLLHLRCNYARLVFASGRLEEGLKELEGMFNDIFVRLDQQVYLDCFEKDKYINIFIYFVLEELARASTGNYDLKGVGEHTYRNLYAFLKSKKDIFPNYIAWLECKIAFMENDMESFAKLVAEYIFSGRDKTSLIWHALVYDVYRTSFENEEQELRTNFNHLLTEDWGHAFDNIPTCYRKA